MSLVPKPHIPFFRSAKDFSNFFTSSKTTSTVSVALGNFDGVHLGHQSLIENLASSSNSKESSAFKLVMSLRPHPKKYFSNSFKILSSLEEKIEALRDAGCTHYVEERFTKDFRDLSPEDFVQHIVLDQLRASNVVVGEDYRFGKSRGGDAEFILKLSKKLNFGVTIVPDFNKSQVRVSSGRVKELLAEGLVDEVSELLGRDFSIIGRVVSGGKRGDSLTGFPTINFRRRCDLITPADGVYVSLLQHGGELRPSVTNIGLRPSVDGHNRFIETHILEGSIGEVYGQKFKVFLKERLRDELKFSSIEELRKAISLDVKKAKEWFKSNG